jgi:hypothetical protein
MSLKRRVALREPKPEIVIVCEGKVTEPRYFDEFRSFSGNSLVTVTSIGGCGVPVSVVERAICEKAERVSRARKSRDSFDLLFEVWAVFDRDAHPKRQVPDAISLAAQNDIQVAFSNPCFEVWGLMHFGIFNRPGHHHEAQAELKKALNGYCHEKNPVMDVRALWERYPDAVTNAERALAARAAEQTPQGDPSTGVHILTERIREFGKR